MSKIKTTFIALTLCFLFIGLLSLYGDQVRDSPDPIFVPFPISDAPWDYESAKRPDGDAATQYYKQMFLGKPLDFVRQVCSDETELLTKWRHIASHIYCGPIREGEYLVLYGFRVREKGSFLPMSNSWHIKIYYDPKDKFVEDLSVDSTLGWK